MNTNMITRFYGANLYRGMIRQLRSNPTLSNEHGNGLFALFSLLEYHAETKGRCVAIPQILSKVFKCTEEAVPSYLTSLRDNSLIDWFGSEIAVINPDRFLYPGRNNRTPIERQYYYISAHWRDDTVEHLMRHMPSPCDLLLYLWLRIVWNDKTVPYSELYPIVYIPEVSESNGLLSEFLLADYLGLPRTIVGNLLPSIFASGYLDDVWFGGDKFLIYSRAAAQLYSGRTLPFGEHVTGQISRDLSGQAVQHEH